MLPAVSVAVNVTVVVPSGKVAGASLVTLTWVSTLSVAVALAKKACIAGVVLAVPALFVADTVILSGVVNTGLLWSLTVMVIVCVAVFPALSVAVNVIVFAPSESVAGALFTTVNTPSIASLAVTAFNSACTAAAVFATPFASVAATTPPCALMLG